MRYFFATAKDKDFKALKDSGFTGVVFDYNEDVKKEVTSASECGLEAWISLNKKESIPAGYLSNIGGRLSVETKTADVVTPDVMEEILLGIDSDCCGKIDGFVVPVPDIYGIIWNDSLDEECQKFGIDKNDSLIDLFVEENPVSTYRSWYYERAERLILKEYLIPLKELAESYGKKVSFDIGEMETQYDLAEKMINPFRIVEDGILFTIRSGKGNSFEAKSMILSLGEDNFNIIAEDCDLLKEFLNENTCDNKADILLIKPSRGVMERYIRRRKAKYRTETSALIAATDGTYYTNMLFEKGFSFHSTDEFGIEKHGVGKDGKFEFKGREYGKILICDSCRFSDKGMEVLKNAEKSGVRINDEGLIRALQSDLEE